MKRQPISDETGGRTPWTAEGAEAKVLLDLASSVAPRVAATEDQSAQWFASSFRQYTESQQKPSAWVALGRWRYALALAGTLAVVVALLRVGSLPDREALTYQMKSGAPVAKLIEAKLEPIDLNFSDGTVVTVERATTARVAETTERGARFRLETGRMAFNVVPRADRGQWSVDAGPFQVRVTGTVFTVEWIAAEGSLRVDVTRGHVVVEGAGQRRELGPGDSFHHREPASTRQPSADVAEKPAQPQDLEPSASPVSPAPSARSEKGTSWPALIAAGEYAAVIEVANQRGVRACLDDCAQDDLRALADAARLSGKAALAERALLAQRARFAGSSDALAAAFLLGRAAEDRHDPKAVGWYDKYLAEAPKGRFAGDALGRKMLLVANGNKQTGAALAAEYLARFPSGPYAGHARGLIEASSRGR
ncbi:MAG TPA: FecR family protein [Polyangiaceae bacterium]|nr:FecR family protein [Polyangiaceae bacterium]